MSSINEALAVEKVQLNHLVLQLEQENEVVSEKVAGLERARVCEQERLSWCERTKAELCAEKAQLEQLLQEAEEQQEGLRVQLRRLAEEKEETREQLSEVSRQQESASTGLEQLRQESSRQGLALAKVSEEKEVLVQEKAALELRLAAVERDRQGLSEQLAEARPVKETLARSLFEAQQRVSQLEIARSHLEMRLHTVTQAKDVIQGEVKCLQRELEAERSLLRQERENAAQQLLRRERQHDDALRLRQSDHEAETQRLLQDLQAAAEGEQLSWLSEKRRLSQRLECLQGAVARLELEKTELKQYNAELRRTLEQVKQAFPASAKPPGALEHHTFPRQHFGALCCFPALSPSPCAHSLSIFSPFWHPLPSQMHIHWGTTLPAPVSPSTHSLLPFLLHILLRVRFAPTFSGASDSL
ncbi:uncharacterized protein [Patagioenas fasciata]|uniref:uncharacterized protein isoform X1 n=1 Tax=Patagioenas fasciata TaxID=372321 RepID=UPI003A990387